MTSLFQMCGSLDNLSLVIIASQFRQKCAKLQQFAIKLLEKAGEKKLIHMSDIPNDLSTSMMSALSLSPNTSLSLPFPSSPPPPLTSPGQSKPFQSSEEMERVREIENSLTLYKQDIDRLESQVRHCPPSPYDTLVTSM